MICFIYFNRNLIINYKLISLDYFALIDYAGEYNLATITKVLQYIFLIS